MKYVLLIMAVAIFVTASNAKVESSSINSLNLFQQAKDSTASKSSDSTAKAKAKKKKKLKKNQTIKY